jgi:hypothetical protein
VHTEKMQDIADFLEDARLAKKVDDRWCDVEKCTANEFTAYLAAVLGKVQDIDSTPITDAPANLDPLFLASQPPLKVESHLAPLRKIVLERLLPVPLDPAPPATLRSFKQKHGELLRRFRYSVEQEIAGIADMTDLGLRTHRIESFVAEKEAEIREIVNLLSRGGLGRSAFSKISAIMAAVPGVSALFGLASAVYAAFSRQPSQPGNTPLLYAAYVHKELK